MKTRPSISHEASTIDCSQFRTLRSKINSKRLWASLTRYIGRNEQVYVLTFDHMAVPFHEYVTSVFHATDSNTRPRIPAEYQDFAEVFSEERANTLFPHCGDLNHVIPLKEQSKLAFGPIYNLSENKLKVLHDYIEEHLGKRCHRPSPSPFGAPVLFVKKPDGSLCFVVHYCALNRMTVKN